MPPESTGSGDELIVHPEACVLAPTPPSRKTGLEGGLVRGRHVDRPVLLVNEQTGDSTRTSVDVLVITPCGKVNLPGVK